MPPGADKRAPIVVDAAPFRLGAGKHGVLLLHGFCGSPFAMRLLGESLAARGFRVLGPRLAGHDPGGRDLGGTTWRDWYASVERAFDELRDELRAGGGAGGTDGRIGVCGLSLGGLLTLELLRRRRADVAAIATLAAPLFLPPLTVRAIHALQRSPRLARLTIPRIGFLGSDIADPATRRINPALGMPVRALGSLVELLEDVRAHIAEIDQRGPDGRPSLVVHARRDHTVPFACADAIATALGGPVERMTLDRSFHVITLDLEREALFARVGDFFERTLRAG